MSAASTPSEAYSAAVSPENDPIKPPTNMLVMSGGEGYIDFRNGTQFEQHYYILCMNKQELGATTITISLLFKFCHS